ncbi:hypothetical protein G7046_g6046 [Stylonectria norvegica]|nr:hypothetical protein G7046_g6046 [Stylonectria norvegica]
MSGPISIGSVAEWQTLLSSTNVVIADFYADWCGPCKMIAPTFEALAKEHSSSKKVAFAKVNVDAQSAIARSNGVAAMPTFKIFHGGACVETIKGANPPALTAAITNAVKLGGAGVKTGAVFKTPGRTLASEKARGGAGTFSSWNITKMFEAVVAFLGLYFVSLFSFDPYKAAEKSAFNVHAPKPQLSTGKPGTTGTKPVQKATFRTSPAITQSFSTSRYLRQEAAAPSPPPPTEDIEQVVRDAKQRFRDTLPKGYLNDEEYALYERLYGPPLRETSPEDVGIPTHADMGPQLGAERTVLRQMEDGEFEEITYEAAREEGIGMDDEVPGSQEGQDALEGLVGKAENLAQKAPTYVDMVARSPREYDAMQRLAQDFEESQRREKEEDALAAAKWQKLLEEQEEEQSNWPPEEDREFGEREPGEVRRFHPLTLEGKFQGSPVEISLPREELIDPVRELLDRTHLDHVKAAAEAAFGGVGLPTSPATPEGKKNGMMVGVGLPADQRHMTEIEADAFVAGFLPPAYASIMSTLREVRKRVGSQWLQSKLKQGKEGGLSVLDAGSGGAGLVAWDQVVKAEWDLLREKGEVKGWVAPGKKTVVVGSERLRNRVKTFLPNTTFLPRLPDYEHSGEMKGVHLDAGDTPQPRKSYDVIIASHLFLQEEKEHYRQAILNNLWSLLKKDGGILIVLEKAHPRGFEAVAHVRDTVLKQFLHPQSGQPAVAPEDFNPAFHREREPGHIIAPCTNHGPCPMYQKPGKSHGRKDYCHFSQRETWNSATWLSGVA